MVKKINKDIGEDGHIPQHKTESMSPPSKGVVRRPELSLCTLDEIKTSLISQGFIDSRSINTKRKAN